ncbi:MAG: MGMT family protein [Blastocatellia bacterium]
MSRKREPQKSNRRVAAPPRPRVEKHEQAFEKIYRVVLKIPRGRVMTYGQIARLMDDRYSPRLVGWAMHATPQDGRDIPWHRVINSKGGISTGRIIIAEPQLQRYLLEAEGVVFDERGHCDLSVYQWSPARRKAKADSLKEPAAKAAKPSTVPAKKRAKR